MNPIPFLTHFLCCGQEANICTTSFSCLQKKTFYFLFLAFPWRMADSHRLFKTHISASGVEHSTTGHFTSATDVNLIVGKNNILEILTLPDSTPKYESTKLLLVGRYRLFGEIQSIQLDHILAPFSKFNVLSLHSMLHHHQKDSPLRSQYL